MRVLTFLLLLASSTFCRSQFVDITEDKNFVPAKSSIWFGAGAAAADYDDDGDIDLFICTGQGNPNFLYQNNNGNFTSIGEAKGLDFMERSRMALWLDVDGDKDLDLLVVGDCHLNVQDCYDDNQMHLYRQENGVFEEITTEAGLASYGPKDRKQRLGGLAAADINGDSFIDFIQVFSNNKIEAFINDGKGVFEEASVSLGLDVGEYYYWQPFFHDFNGDGYIDIYCNIDFNENQLFLNNGDGHFDEKSKVTNSNNSFNEMGITLGDIDGDGDFDIYSTNSENYLDQDVYNILLQQNKIENDQISFTEIAKDLNIHQGGWGWGATFFDSNNDGLLDLAATNGWHNNDPDQSKIWIQQSDNTFSDQSSELGFDDHFNAATLISFDYDRDGDLDMVQTIKEYEDEMAPLRLLENQTPSNDIGHYLVVKPRMEGHNHFAIGATVTAFAKGKLYTRIIHAGTSFYGQEPAEAFIGVGQEIIVDSLNITWPGGEVSWWYDIAVDQIVTLTDDQVVHRPGGFKIQQNESETILTWYDVSESESGYILQKSTDMNFESYSEILLPANSTSYVDLDALIYANYFYRIQTYNAESSSRFTEILQIENIVLSVDDKSFEEIRIFPNPTSSTINIQSPEKITSIRLFAIDGTEITSFKYQTQQGKTSINLDLKNTPKGSYLLKINAHVKRIIIK